MSRETVARLLGRFMGISSENRRLIAGVEPGREDVILAGTAILATVMDAAGMGYFVACDWGLREGNLLHFARKGGGR